jgi:hypothetical protein
VSEDELQADVDAFSQGSAEVLSMVEQFAEEMARDEEG